jgi:hypothetical protein
MPSQKNIPNIENILAKLKKFRSVPRKRRILMWIPVAWEWTLICFKTRASEYFKLSNILDELSILAHDFVALIAALLGFFLSPLTFIFYIPVAFCVNWYQRARMTDDQIDRSIEGWTSELERRKELESEQIK